MMRFATHLIAVALCLTPGTAALSADDGPIARGLALRARHGIASPASKTIVHIYTIAVHHLREEFSTIAIRDASGHWQVSDVGETGGALAPAKDELIPERKRTLSDVEGRTLDRLLADHMLYHETFVAHRQPEIGEPFHHIEVVTPGRRLEIDWIGRLRGRAGRIADLLVGHA